MPAPQPARSRITITHLEPCGCDAEGSVRFRFEGDAREYHGYYQANDVDAARCFAKGSDLECFVRVVWGELSTDEAQVRGIETTSGHGYEVRGAFVGWVEHEGEQYAAVDAGRIVLVAPESDIEPPPTIGDRVRVSVTFQLDCP